MKRALDNIIDAARKVKRNGQPLSADPVIRQQLAQAYIRVDIMRLNNYRSITNQLRGQPPGPEASLDKLYWSETNKWMQEVGQEMLGPFAQLDPASVYYPTAVNLQASFL